jgi:hypothetical protein
VDCHWYRGNSYLRLGWQWVQATLHQGWQLFHTLQLVAILTLNAQSISTRATAVLA